MVRDLERLSKAELPLVVSSIGLKEERNRVAVTITADDPDAAAEILAYDSIGGAIEIAAPAVLSAASPLPLLIE